MNCWILLPSLPKICPHIEVPVQSGDDDVLHNMRRGYTPDDYRHLVQRIRENIPGVSIATDIIVGFPGETEQQFQNTYDLLEELRLDVIHLARYSPRPNTVATRQMSDDVPEKEKMRRFRLLEEQQERIVTEIHATYLGRNVPILFEEKVKNRWRGRTETNKLVFVESDLDLRGKLLPVNIIWTGPWSMLGQIETGIPSKIRDCNEEKQNPPIAIGVFIHDGRILVFEGFDQVKDKIFLSSAGRGNQIWRIRRGCPETGN